MLDAAAATILASLLTATQLLDPDGAVPLQTITSPPTIDAVLEDAAWAMSQRLELTYETQPGDNTPASERTEVRLTRDDKYLYVAVRAWDTTPSAIRARMVRRDELSAEDYIVFTLDTDDARQRAYRFFINPLGLQADAIYTVAGNDDYSWDGLFDSAGRVSNEGYVVEARIPFKSLRFRSGAGTRWGLHVERWIARKGERTSWRLISRDNASYLGQMGSLAGLDSARGGRAIDLVPTIVAAGGESRANSSSPLGKQTRHDVGLTGLYALTSNLTVSGAINPDFSQVEADSPQITVNQRFAISYPEKRPFFLEGAEFFTSATPSGYRLLDTRTLVNPDWGLKLTGRSGRQAIGVLFAGDDPATGDDAFASTARFQRDLFSDAAVGGMVVDRRQGGQHNTVIAGDSRFRVRKVNTTGVQVARSTTRDGSSASNGTAYRAMWTTYARTWKIFLWDQGVSRDFRAASGFLSRAGYHQSFVDVGYEWRPAKPAWWTSFWPYILTSRSLDADGKLEFENADPAWQLDLPRNVRLNYYYSLNRDGFADGDFRYQFQSASITVNRFKRLTFYSRARWGGGMLYDRTRPQVGRMRAITQNATARLHEQLSLELQYTSNVVHSRVTGSTLSAQHLTRLKLQWQARPSVGLRVISDYDSAASRLGWSVLYAYTPRPLTAIYVGYNDLQLDQRGVWSRQQRTLFAKLSYGWRM